MLGKDVGKPVIADGQALITGQLPCVQATFYRPEGNPFLAITATDDRGTLYGLDYVSVRPDLVEIIHSERGAIRGNHVHRHCTETFTVMSGEISMFLLCTCPGRHLLEEVMVPGMTVRIVAGTPHAIFSRTKSESVAAYGDGDPRHDRDRVMLLEY
jgi:mannose-6-phosphate isomerase-like protein (cupin superfamily)